MLRRNLTLKTIAIVTVGGLVILAGLAVGAVRLIDQVVPGYRAELAAWVGDKLDQPLTIGGMELVWRWRGPSLRLSDVALLNSQGEPTGLALDALALRFTFLDLLHGRALPHSVVLIGPELEITQGPEGQFRLQDRAGSNHGDADMQTLAARLQQIENIRIIHGELQIHLNKLTRPLRLTDLTLSLSNRESRHHLTAQAKISSHHAEHVQAEATVLGDLTKPGATSGHIRLRVSALAGPQLLQLAGIDTRALHGGQTDIELSANWSARHLTEAQATMQVNAFKATVADGKRLVITPPLTAQVHASAAGGAMQIRLHSLTSRAFTAGTTSGSITFDPKSERVHGEFSDVPARLISAALHLWRPQSMHALKASGRLDQLAFTHNSKHGWQLKALFAGIRVENHLRHIEAGPFGGSLTLHDHGGKLKLDIHNAGIRWQRYIRGRLPLAALSASIHWQQSEQGRTIKLQDLRLVSAKTTVTGGGTVRLPTAESPIADLHFQIRTPNVAPILDYLPQTKDMDFWHLRDWLPKAILSGHIKHGTVRVHGPLNQFPFAHGDGTFRVKLKGEGMDLAYKPGWPILKDIRGTFTLHGDTIDIHGTSAHMLGVELDAADAHIDDIHKPILKVAGTVAEADAAAMLAFLPNSPLREKFGRLAQVLDVSGPAGLFLQLSVPLKPELGEVAVDGRIELAGVKLNHEMLPKPIRNIRGSVRFDRHGLYAERLKASFTGLPITAAIKPAPASEGSDALAIHARTHIQLPADADNLTAILPRPLLDRATGEALWHVKLQVSASGRTSGLRISSNLQGMALNLPAPLGKPAKAVVPLTLTLTNGRSHVRLHYGERLSLTAHLGEEQLQSLNVIFGGANVTPPPGPGVWVGGKLPVVPINEWRNLANAFNGGGKSGLVLRSADVHVAGLRLGNRRIGPTSIQVLPLIGADGWVVGISGKGASGHLRWLAAEHGVQINARFKQVSLTTGNHDSSQHKADASEPVAEPTATVIDPAALPTIHLLVQKLSLNGDSLGRLKIQTDAIAGGLALLKLSLAGNGLSLAASGRWVRNDGVSQASLKAQISGTGIGQLVRTLGFGETITAKSTSIKADLHFAPNPAGLALGALNGQLHLQMKNGMLVSVEPGAGRILGLLNLYALPRRLLLDFGDVLGEGLAFETLAGDFRIESGIAYTDNLEIETSSATIQIDGRINLAARTYNEQVTIEPKVASAATIAGTVLGGPVIGLVVFVLQDLFDQPLAEIATVSYHLSGSWADPVIKSVQAE